MSELDKKYKKAFEEDHSLAEILILRQLALEKNETMKKHLQGDDPDMRQKANDWFKTLDSRFDESKLEKIQSYDQMQSKKSKQSKISIQVVLHLKGLTISVEENEIMSEVKNMH